MKNFSNLNQNPESPAAQLAVIAGIITTIGDALGTLAAALAIQEMEQSLQSNPNVESLQKQIDQLNMEICHIKKLLISKRY